MYDQVKSNKRRSALLIAAFVGIVILAGIAFNILLGFGPVGVVIAVLVAGGLAVGSYWKSDSIALAMSRAQPASVEEYPRLHNIVEGLCIAAGLPKPRLYIVQDEAPNAFATGRDPKHAAVAVTTGLLAKMNRIELEAVLAHELSHVKNYDILVSTLAVTLVGAVALLSDIGIRSLWFGGGRRSSNNNDNGGAGALLMIVALVFLVLAPIAARLMQLAVSRRRETLADFSGVEMTRYPPGMVAALEKLQADQTVVASGSRATAHLWIEQPMARTKEEGPFSRLNGLFDTHPPLEERIAALREL